MNKIVESLEAVREKRYLKKWGFVQQSDARRCFK